MSPLEENLSKVRIQDLGAFIKLVPAFAVAASPPWCWERLKDFPASLLFFQVGQLVQACKWPYAMFLFVLIHLPI